VVDPLLPVEPALFQSQVSEADSTGGCNTQNLREQWRCCIHRLNPPTR
jgi:hypothetical protein